jgi:hypothetical protein
MFGLDWIEVADVGGCAANDGWALTGLSFWAADDAERGATLLADGRASMAANEGWTSHPASGGAYLREAYMPYGYMQYTSVLATSFAPAALGGWTGPHARRVRDAFAYMEAQYGRAIDTDGDGVDDAYLYDTDGKPDESTHNQTSYLRMWATANLALGTSFDAHSIASLYDGSATRAAASRPHLAHLVPAAPRALVRRAVFSAEADGETGTLQILLTSSSPEGTRGVRLTIAVPRGWRRSSEGATPTAHEAHERSEPTEQGSTRAAAETTFDMVVDVEGAKDTAVDVPFARTQASTQAGRGIGIPSQENENIA